MNNKPENQVKRKFITVPVTEKQYEEIKKLSEIDGRKMADFMRRKSLGL